MRKIIYLVGLVTLALMLWAGLSYTFGKKTDGLYTQPEQSNSTSSISREELIEAIKSEDINRIVVAMNRAKRSQKTVELMTFIYDLWTGNERKHPSLPWSVINKPVVKIELAHILIQASNNGYMTVDREEIRGYAKQVISKNEEDVDTALLILGSLRTSADIQLLKEVALQERSPGTFRTAIFAISVSCHPDSLAVLKAIEMKVQGDARSFVQKSEKETSQNCSQFSGSKDNKPQPAQYYLISREDLIEVIKSEDTDRIIAAMNKAGINQSNVNLLAFVNDLWSGDESKNPDLPWSIINKPVVRIELAKVLVQASNNGHITVNREDIRNYAKQMINNNEKGIGAALLTLGMLNNSADIQLLKEKALEEDPHTFQDAIFALSLNCDPDSLAALRFIEAKVQVAEKSFIQQSERTVRQSYCDHYRSQSLN
ncbi:MAG: hypothetical protein LBV44_06435 [Methylobacillus sp.]|jgi:hypothetical protein|nr:hypothetical protein [Methylobacillus sp.]